LVNTRDAFFRDFFSDFPRELDLTKNLWAPYNTDEKQFDELGSNLKRLMNLCHTPADMVQIWYGTCHPRYVDLLLKADYKRWVNYSKNYQKIRMINLDPTPADFKFVVSFQRYWLVATAWIEDQAYSQKMENLRQATSDLGLQFERDSRQPLIWLVGTCGKLTERATIEKFVDKLTAFSKKVSCARALTDVRFSRLWLS